MKEKYSGRRDQGPIVREWGAYLNSKKAAMSGVERAWEAEGRRCWAGTF